MSNDTLSFIYVHRDGNNYSYCNNLNTAWPFHPTAWKELKASLKPGHSYAILNKSFISSSASGHNYSPICILMEIDSLSEAKQLNTAYYTGYRKIHEDKLEHLVSKNDILQEFVDRFAELLIEYADQRKMEKDELEARITDHFTDFRIEDFFDLVDDEEDDDEPLKMFFNME